MPAPPLVEMREVAVTKGRTTVLREVNLRIERGERIVILGPNGSGKSTLVRTMTGEDRHDTSVEGSSVRIRGEENWDLFDVRKAFGVVSGEMQLEFHRGMEAVEAVLSGFFGSIGTNRSQDITAEMEAAALTALEAVGAGVLARRRVSTLSTGEARRVLMARALVHRPDALVLDEPMSSLDLTGKHLVRESMRSLARSGRTLVLVTHDPADIIPEMGRVIMMKNGRVFSDGGMDTLSSESLTALFEVPVQLKKVGDRYLAWS
jgi:iron complex transport system ATP-binding protein